MRVLKKCGNRVDRINRLPDDIILHILSFLPTADACYAGQVCRRWLYMWGCIPNLTFKSARYSGLFQTITHVERARTLSLALKSHKALSLSLKEFKLDFSVPKRFQHLVGRWLAYAFSRGVERLDLNLGDDGALFDKHMLKEIATLRLPSLNLKVLFLRCIMMNGGALELLLRNCPLLERLVIYRPRRRSDTFSCFKNSIMMNGDALELLLRNCPLLERLVIYRPRRRSDLVIDSPSLKHLDMRSRNFKSELGDSMHHFANVAAQLQTLIIHLSTPEELFRVPEMPKLKKLVIYFRFNWKNVSLPVTRFISASPCLEEFRLEISELYFSHFPSPPSVPVDIFEVPKAPSPHCHLKRFVFSGYRGVRRYGDTDFGHFDVSLELVRYVVDNCVSLEEIVIGQCHLVGLVRDIVDYGGESLDDIILDPASCSTRYAATLEEQRAFGKLMQRQQIPSHIKLRIVYEVETQDIGLSRS